MTDLISEYSTDTKLLDLITLAHTYNSSRGDNSLLAFKELLILAQNLKAEEGK